MELADPAQADRCAAELAESIETQSNGSGPQPGAAGDVVVFADEPAWLAAFLKSQADGHAHAWFHASLRGEGLSARLKADGGRDTALASLLRLERSGDLLPIIERLSPQIILPLFTALDLKGIESRGAATDHTQEDDADHPYCAATRASARDQVLFEITRSLPPTLSSEAAAIALYVKLLARTNDIATAAELSPRAARCARPCCHRRWSTVRQHQIRMDLAPSLALLDQKATRLLRCQHCRPMFRRAGLPSMAACSICCRWHWNSVSARCSGKHACRRADPGACRRRNSRPRRRERPRTALLRRRNRRGNARIPVGVRRNNKRRFPRKYWRAWPPPFRAEGWRSIRTVYLDIVETPAGRIVAACPPGPFAIYAHPAPDARSAADAIAAFLKHWPRSAPTPRARPVLAALDPTIRLQPARPARSTWNG